MQTSGASRREKAMLYPPVIASEAKQSMLRHKERMDCFASLAMTWRERRQPGSYAAGCATFGPDHGCRSAILVEGLRPTVCRGMLDTMFEGFTTFSDRAACLTS
ncbi:hypothetical protein V1293_000543 [Bradyrhizobium sp. AZCC 1693]